MKKHTFILFIWITCLLSGCILEDQSDCRRSFTLLFRYTGDGTTDIFREKVTKVNLYVYDAHTQQLVQAYEMDSDDLQRLQGIRLDNLQPGDYEAVCWGNVFESSTVTGESQREDGSLAAPEYHTGQPADTNDPHYYGNTLFTVTNDWTDQQDVCNFRCTHIDIKVRLEGFNDGIALAGTRAESACPVNLHLENLPGYCCFHGNTHDESATYEPALTAAADDASAYESTFCTLRFTDDSDVTLYLTRPADGQPIYSLRMEQFLTENGLSVEDEQEETVEILLRLNTDGVSISVTPFEEEEVHPGMDERRLQLTIDNGQWTIGN